MNVPNFITIIRLFLGIIGGIALFSSQWLLAAISITVAVLLDIADGKVARKLKQVTTAGIYLDIMTDKIVIVGTLLILGALNIFPFAIGLLLFVREYLIDSTRTIAMSNKKVISANWHSKFKGLLFMISLTAAIWAKAVLSNPTTVILYMQYLSWIALIFSYWSLAVFIWQNWGAIRIAAMQKK